VIRRASTMRRLPERSTSRRARLGALTLAAIVLLMFEGCTLVASIDRTQIPHVDGAGHGHGGGEHSSGVPTSSGVGGSGGGLAVECTVEDVVGACGLDTSCRKFACVDATCSVTAAPAGTPCSEDNGIACDGKGNCLDAHCGNGAIDGNETDLDCGGTTCLACVNGRACASLFDCESGVCSPAMSGAAGAGGGPMAAGICVACTDSFQCAPGSYCDPKAGGTCSARLAVAQKCTVDDACASGHCVDGICCATSCIGTCLACHEEKTGKASGLCEPVAAGIDPDSECPDSPMSCLTGMCDGSSGVCARTPSGTVCRPAAGPCGLAELCDDSVEGCPADAHAGQTFGACASPKVCDGLGPGEDHCKYPSGEMCNDDVDCISGNCSNGVCG